MKDYDKKFDIVLHRHEAVQLLKMFAGGFSHPVLPEVLKGIAAYVEPCAQFDFSLKLQGGMAEMKLKVKGLAGQEEACSGKSPVKYFKSIKKRLKSSLRFLQHSAENRTLPSAVIVESFLTDSLAMCSHPARGHHDYSTHLRLCNELKTAFDKKDKETLGVVLAELEASQRFCHARVK